MRTIIFRGKRKDNGEWLVSGTLLQNSDDERFCWLPVYGDKFGTAEDDKGNILRMEYGTLYRVAPETVSQYTGLKDKNGKRIFEGDIVQIEDFTHGCALNYKQPTSKWVVHWRKDTARFCIDYMSLLPFDFTQSEIIGNIHDNGVEELNGD